MMLMPVDKPSQDTLRPSPPKGMGRGLMLAIAVHVLLIIGLAVAVHWRSSDREGVEAELWAQTPQIAAPKADPQPPTPTPTPPQVQPPQPVQPPPPKVEPKPEVDPQIAIERDKQKKREEQKKRDEEKKEEQRKKLLAQQEAQKHEREEQKKRDELKKQQEAKQKAADEKRLAQLREQNMKRLMGQVNATGGPESTGTAERTAGPSAGYVGRIKARVLPHVVFNQSLTTNPSVEVLVKAAPDGTILSATVHKSSGVPEWDDAVVRAFEATGSLPRDVDGRVPGQMLIVWRPRD